MTGIPDGLQGTISGCYVLQREIGHGGMATVYLAQDLRHDRAVALKVLGAELAAVVGAERFNREIQIAARLNHPHILPVHDSGEMAGYLYYVMPYVAGESLRDHLQRIRQLPVRDALRIAREAADALDFAHRQGIVHRDIKPENILLSEGHAVVADFGIAAAVSAAAGDRLTPTGLTLGTPAYMSPEQAAGEHELDGRSDIYSLGCVLYEMLAGEPPFTGATPQAVMARRITQRVPSLRIVRDSISERVDRVVATALAPPAADRFQTAAEFGSALASAEQSPVPSTDLASYTRRRRRPIWVASIVLTTILGGLGVWILSQRKPPSFVVENAIQVTHDLSLEFDPSLSPDGRLVAYAIGGPGYTAAIAVRSLGEGRAVRLTDSSLALPRRPSWSPDGTRIAFEARDGIFVVPSLGGTPRRLIAAAPGSFGTRGPAWSPDGASLAYAMDSGIRVFSIADEKTRIVDTGLDVRSQLTWSPDGRWLAYVSGNRTGAENIAPSAINIIRSEGGSPIALTDRASANLSPVWMSDSRTLLFVSGRGGGRDVYAMRIGGDGSPENAPVRLTTGLSVASIAMSRNGDRLAYATLRRVSSIWYSPTDGVRAGSLGDARPLLQRDEAIEGISLSHDGRWLVFDSNLSGNQDIYRVPTTGGDPERLTQDPADDFHGEWSPGDSEIAFYSIRGGSRDIYVMNADGSQQRQVTSGREQEADPHWSPDGRRIVYSDDFHLFLIGRRGDGSFESPQQFTRFSGIKPRWSPDGDSIAFVSKDPPPAIRLVALNGLGRTVVTAPRGTNPAAMRVDWGPKRLGLYYRVPDQDGSSIVEAGSAQKPWRVLLPAGTGAILFSPGNDGRGVFFTRERRESEVWILTLARR